MRFTSQGTYQKTLEKVYIFVPIPKVSRAQECSDYRTSALISHASKVLLHLIKRRITPIIERQLGESQMGFRKRKGHKKCHLPA